jgi:phage-related protein (TIGR01555 family)
MSTPLNWLRDKLRAWLDVPAMPIEAPTEDENAPTRISIHPSLMARTMVKAGEDYLMYRKVEAPQLPSNVRGDFKFDASKDPGALGAPVLAMDDGQNAPVWAYLNQANCGMGFPGYGYLSELSQRSEYRSPVETLADEMTREFIDITVKGKASKKKRAARGEKVEEVDADEDGDIDGGLEDKIEQLEAAIEEFNLREHFRKLAEYDGFFGRGQLFIDIDYGNGNVDDIQQTPLVVDPQTIKKGSLKGFKTIEPIWTTPYSYNATDPTRADFYKPVAWFVIGKRVHSSRLLTFISRAVPDILKPAYNFGGLSMSQLMEPYVFQWLRTRNSVSDLVHNFSVMVLKTDMNAVLQGGSGSHAAEAGMGILDRAKLFTNTRDNQGLMLIDMKREEMQVVEASLSGLDKLQAQSQEHMAAPSHMPLVKLTGITPAGLNADSEGEIKVWYDHVGARQQTLYGPHLPHVLEIMQLHLFGNIDDAIGYAFVPLDSPTVKELAEIRKSNAETDGTYIDKGVISPDEARERLGSDPDSGYNNLSGDAPGPPEMGLMDQEHELGQQGAEADHGRGEESAEAAHSRALEMKKTEAKLTPKPKPGKG